ncbi:glutathione transferase GstA [Variovorax sp. SG517]|uniref:glutathione transferase GstA n=1 Tax=unclassified Variovorax TaxID=663243 RepID=UPI00159DA81F|nr:glutathione transferase GstA [Variovorax sp. SG517]NVM90493.1 glutathione S-transferase [Variovorax sp. SG517]
MKLYHEVRGCSLSVDIVARELQLPLALEWVDMKTKRLADGRDYFGVNSKGTVPTLEMPDGQHLSEGCIVMQYLADQCPGNTLLPASGLPRYRVLEWMSFIAADLHKGGFMPLFKAVTPPEYKAIARGIVEAKLQWVDEQLAGRTYLTGDTFTIADAHCYTIAMWTRAHAIDTRRWPDLEAYLARCSARPSVRAAEAAAAAQGERERAAAAAAVAH